MIRLLVADDYADMMHAIRRLCASYTDVEIVAEVARFPELQEAAQSNPHDIILMNDTVPPLHSVGAVAKLREIGITTPILVMSMFHDADRIRRNLEAGSNGYIAKEELVQELRPAIHALHNGQTYLSPWCKAALSEEEA